MGEMEGAVMNVTHKRRDMEYQLTMNAEKSPISYTELAI